ncbi:hypothetical protein [Anaeromyxobacter sp. PSR-1]|uniref:baeRF10 domain-containing protein n=1 Tax=unclassified Anaeromyxobacter TaxID=2620896 RepID=UPI0005DFA9EE|nr:hypothetical protein [Anaeromyxobacter sp. PSR-1]GAO01380.1 hypothetical protein PSR1_00234 [Anaeromyxobacter sp. PSR-1]
MTELDGTLTDLARLRSVGEPIVSLYLDVRWADEQQRERVRLFVQERVRQTLAHYPPGTPDRPALDRTLQRVLAHVGQLTTQASQAEKDGFALFACEGLGLWQPMLFRRPFAPELCTDAIPHLTQLARLADDLEPAIVVVPNQAGADLYEVRLGELAAESSLRGFVPRRDRDRFNPGAARPGQRFERQEKDGRHEEAFVQRNRRAAAAEVELRLARTPGAHLVLVGTAQNVAAFERELPERARARVIARLPRPREWEGAGGARRDGVVAGASGAVAEHERAAERRIVDGLVGEALRGGLGVVGPEDVVQAVNEGRVHRLVLEEDFQRAGWQCDRCTALGATRGADLCPYCGGDLHTVQQLGEALVARTLAGGGAVEVVAHANRLHGYRGVGAFLRQTAPTGLRGASPPWPTAPGASQP